MTPAEIITEARVLIQDTRVPYRYSDADMLRFVNQTLRRILVLRPDLFMTYGMISTVANTVAQKLPSDAYRLVEIYSVVGGGSVLEVNRETLDQTVPDWSSGTPGQPVNYMRHVRNPTRYFLYPPPKHGVKLNAEYVKSPPMYGMSDTIDELSDSYLSVMVDGVVFLAESVDNEHVSSGRAQMFLESFTQSLGVSLQSRDVTDTEQGGLDDKKVI